MKPKNTPRRESADGETPAGKRARVPNKSKQGSADPWKKPTDTSKNPRPRIPAAPFRAANPGETVLDGDDGVRINRFIASTGFCSRRKADDHILAGEVTLNGKPVTQPGVQVDPVKDQVRVQGKLLACQKPVYVMMNKPKNTITTLEDPEGRQTVADLLTSLPERVFPVGRLDRNTTGILLFTNDGLVAKRLTHPSHRVRKVYHVELYATPTPEQLQRLADGIRLEDGMIQADRIDYVDNIVGPKVGIEIHSGRNRIVRRMFEYFGYRIKSLDRVAFGPLDTKGVSRGSWRILTAKEIAQIRKLR